MIALLYVFFLGCAIALVLGQGRSVLAAFRNRRAGWGRLSFALASSPIGFIAMAALELGLFALACFWLISGIVIGFHGVQQP